jgi:hypothetical protein
MECCVRNLVGPGKCGCWTCKRDRALRRTWTWVWITVVMGAIVLALSFFAPSAECHPPGRCYGGCVLGAGCGTGPGCACVPSLPGSPLGTCVGG